MSIAPAPASVSINQVNVEIGRAGTAKSNMDEVPLRTLAGVSTTSGVRYTMDNFRGKSSYVAMTTTGVADYGESYSSSYGGGRAYTYPSVTVTGGSVPYSYSWTIASSTGTSYPTIDPATAHLYNPTVYVDYSYQETGDYDSFLQCVVTDNTGHSVTVSSIEAYAYWDWA